jgi:hypothetical protein
MKKAPARIALVRWRALGTQERSPVGAWGLVRMVHQSAKVYRSVFFPPFHMYGTTERGICE